MSKTEPQVFSVLTKFSCAVVNAVFYWPIGRFWWRKIFRKNLLILFFHFAFSDIERERLTFCRKLSVWLSKLQYPHLKHFVEIYFFSKRLFLFLSVLSASENEHNLLVFLKKLAGLSKLPSMCPEEILFEKKKDFWEKPVFISSRDMGQKKLFFCQTFFSRCCQNFTFLSIGSFRRKTFFWKTQYSSCSLLTLDK